MSQLADVAHCAYDKGYEQGKKDVADSGWIRVKDRLPKIYGTYLVYLGMPDKLVHGSGVHTAWYYSGSQEFSFSLNTAKMLGEDCSTKIKSASVTHWMPLPEPPKMDVQEEVED